MSTKKIRIVFGDDEVKVYDYEQSVFHYLEILDIPGVSIERITSKSEHDKNLYHSGGMYRSQDNRLVFIKSGNQSKPKFPLTITLTYDPSEISVSKSVYNQLVRYCDEVIEENKKYE